MKYFNVYSLLLIISIHATEQTGRPRSNSLPAVFTDEQYDATKDLRSKMLSNKSPEVIASSRVLNTTPVKLDDRNLRVQIAAALATVNISGLSSPSSSQSGISLESEQLPTGLNALEKNRELEREINKLKEEKGLRDIHQGIMRDTLITLLARHLTSNPNALHHRSGCFKTAVSHIQKDGSVNLLIPGSCQHILCAKCTSATEYCSYCHAKYSTYTTASINPNLFPDFDNTENKTFTPSTIETTQMVFTEHFEIRSEQKKIQ